MSSARGLDDSLSPEGSVSPSAESVLVALAEAVQIDDPDRLMRHLAQSWRTVTRAEAVFVAVEHGSARALRTVTIDKTGLVTHAPLRLTEPADLVGEVTQSAVLSAIGSTESSRGRDVIVQSLVPSSETRPVGVMLLQGGGLLPEMIQRLFLSATADLISRAVRRDRLLRDAKLESLAEFAAGAGHEINNPLAAISGRVQLLLREEQDPQRRRHLATIGAQSLRIRDMIGDTMLFARPPQPEPKCLNLSDMLDRVIDRFAEDCMARGLTMARTDRADVPIWADETQLCVVISELLRNAIEASPTGGTIHIEASREAVGEQEWARLRVRDEGAGLLPEAAEHLFDPFYSGRQAGRGLGFGLSKCWRIVTNHGGQIDVENELSQGFGILVRWPSSDSASTPPIS